ncbi:MAG: TonB-dependent receptor plug domain-containing protein, partial [Bacteroidales bacterium]|nr:TonB-dependent receptor plug domain-containing protein [Bacteroidales bacterium]
MAKLMQKTFRAILVIAALFIAPMTALAQSGLTVEVTVVDDIGPVAGASVIVEGTTNGSVTDIDGVAVVRNVPKDGTLVVSFIGYNTENVKVNNRTKINVTMSVSTEFIDESVVVGYGVQKKESLTSAISQIAAQDIENTKQIDVVTSLQGKIPGLLVTQGSSRPGEFNSTFSLRGYSGAPMIVVDGVVRSGGKRYQNWWTGTQMVDDMSALQELDPEDIETISVLKDASAAIYGLGASNGVILITTKKGKVQKPTISL